MTYAQLLLLFIVPPIAVLTFLLAYHHSQNFAEQRHRKGASPLASLIVIMVSLMIVAIIYTIPWDNHLITIGVWRYKSTLISGQTFGKIPLEEITFFPLQTALVELWLVWLASRSAQADIIAGRSMRVNFRRLRLRTHKDIKVQSIITALGACMWLAALATLCSGWRPGTYLSWELTWALPPLLLQLFLGGDLLWRSRRCLAMTLIPAVIYLCAIDAFAIHIGIWTIDPRQTLGLLLGGQLPVEELIFYVLTSSLVAFGLTLWIALDPQ